MTISQAEELKRHWTDKYVVVQSDVAELRRFQGLTGTVKTVNMSGRALVEFDGPVDIGWYDIDPAFLQRVEQPLPRKEAAPAKSHAAPAASAPPPASAPKPAAAKGSSALDLIRKQGAAKPAADAPAVAETPPAAPESTIEAAPAPVAETPRPAAKPGGMSALDLIRQQGAAKR